MFPVADFTDDTEMLRQAEYKPGLEEIMLFWFKGQTKQEINMTEE